VERPNSALNMHSATPQPKLEDYKHRQFNVRADVARYGLVQIEGQWTLMYKGSEYMRLLEATSRDDAEQQIAEMLFVYAKDKPVAIETTILGLSATKP
jgi:hypothetical protein